MTPEAADEANVPRCSKAENSRSADSSVRSVRVSGGQVATQCFGRRSDPALLLVMGATASMLGWPDGLCRALARRGLFVVRFDHRDTGRSSTLPAGPAAYAVEDMARDVVSIADAYALPHVAVMGMSLGGYIAQMVALDQPERVKALVLVGAEPLGWDGPPLPHMTGRLDAHWRLLPTLDTSDRDAVMQFLVELDRLCAGTGHVFDAVTARARIEKVLARTDSPGSLFNHAGLSVQKDWTGRFRDIRCPVLVLHGAEDPVLPVENGRAIAAGLPSAELIVFDGVGHELPDRCRGTIAERVARHTHAALRRPP